MWKYKMQSHHYRQFSSGAAYLALFCCMTQLAAVASAASDSPSAIAPIRVPPQNLDGKGITTPFDMNEMKPFIDGQEGAMPTTFHKLIFKNQLLVDVVETSGVGVHFPNHPDDELVLVKAGRVTMTSDATGIAQTIKAGEWVVVPKGWVGWWRASPGEYRELAIAASRVSGEAPPTANRDISPIHVKPSTAAGNKTIYTGNVLVEEVNLSKSDRSVDQASDEAVQVLGGVLTLESGKSKEQLKAGAVLVIPKGFKGKLHVSNGYHALVVRVPDASH
jgi:quercetin dioxygenase-like cupin family protein